LKIDRIPRESHCPRRGAMRLDRAALLLLSALAAPCSAGDEPKAAPSAAGNDSAFQVIEMINQNESLNSEVTRLRGQLDEVLDTIKKSQERQKKFAADLDSRVGKIETERKAQSRDAQTKVKALEDKVLELERSLAVLRQALSDANQAAEEDPAQKAYGIAIKEYEAGDYAAAIRHLSAFVELFPGSAVTPDAQYWLGDALWRQRDYAAAITAEENLLTKYPQSKKAPDAWLLIGKSHLSLGDVEAAQRSWQQLVENHPDSDPARKARELLKKLP
jgi:tol-pal system protein YbgF